MSKIEVQYINHMGDELTVVNAARVSFGNQKSELNEKDKKLIKYLADNRHYSPFEHCFLTVKIKCPLYIRSQIMRHRTFSYNEISRRYTSKNLEFYTPDVLRKQSQANKQCSYGALGDQEQEAVKVEISQHHENCLALYESLLSMGVCREQARGVLPQDLMTEFYMSGNIRNWAHFLSLRNHHHAQLEVQIIAKEIQKILLDKFNYVMEVLLEKKV